MAILTTTDLVASLPNELMPFLDIGGAARPTESLLGQLLLKGGSNDKRFVIDEVDRALARMTQKLDAEILLEKLLPYSTHKGPKVLFLCTSLPGGVVQGFMVESKQTHMALSHRPVNTDFV